MQDTPLILLIELHFLRDSVGHCHRTAEVSQKLRCENLIFYFPHSFICHSIYAGEFGHHIFEDPETELADVNLPEPCAGKTLFFELEVS